jgi:hypothetical protein
MAVVVVVVVGVAVVVICKLNSSFIHQKGLHKGIAAIFPPPTVQHSTQVLVRTARMDCRTILLVCVGCQLFVYFCPNRAKQKSCTAVAAASVCFCVLLLLLLLLLLLQ